MPVAESPCRDRRFVSWSPLNRLQCWSLESPSDARNSRLVVVALLLAPPALGYVFLLSVVAVGAAPRLAAGGFPLAIRSRLPLRHRTCWDFDAGTFTLLQSPSIAVVAWPFQPKKSLVALFLASTCRRIRPRSGRASVSLVNSVSVVKLLAVNCDSCPGPVVLSTVILAGFVFVVARPGLSWIRRWRSILLALAPPCHRSLPIAVGGALAATPNCLQSPGLSGLRVFPEIPLSLPKPQPN